MAPVILADQLFIYPEKHEQIMKDLMACYAGVIRVEVEAGIDKKWDKISNFDDWRVWPMATKDYIQNVLRELLIRK
jgi:hypothetical protein